MGTDQFKNQAHRMSTNTLHEIKNLLHRLELIAELLVKKDFSHFSAEEIKQDFENDMATLATLMKKISSDQ